MTRIARIVATLITPGQPALVDGQLVHAADLNNLIANALVGSGFITTQPINNNPLTSDYLLEYSPTLNNLYKISLQSVIVNPSTWISLASGVPNIYTNDLFQFFSQATPERFNRVIV